MTHLSLSISKLKPHLLPALSHAKGGDVTELSKDIII